MADAKTKPLLTTCSACGVLHGVAAGRCPICPTTSLLAALLGSRKADPAVRAAQAQAQARAAAQMARLVRWDSKQQQ